MLRLPSRSAPLAILFAACAAAPADPFASEWSIVEVPGAPSLRAVDPVDARVVWAAGSGGAVLRSLDGGANWQQVGPRGRADDFRSLVAFDADRALVAVAGEPAQVLATDDGGSSWQVVLEDPRPGAFFDSLAFADRDRGLLFGDPVEGEPTLFATRDGGASWAAIGARALPPFAVGEAGFAASNSLLVLRADGRCWLATGGARARVLRGEAHGERWEPVAVPLLQGEASQGVFAIAFADERHGIAVGGDYRAPARGDGTAAFTTDGGRSWTAAAEGAGGYRSGVAFVPGAPGAAIAVGENGASVTRDGGRTWQPLPGPGFHAVRVAADGTVFAVGARGRIGRLAVR